MIILDLFMYFPIDIHMFASYNRPVDAEGTMDLSFNTDESKHQSTKKFNDLINQTVKELVEKY